MTVLGTIWTACGGDPSALSHVSEVGTGELPSAFAVSDLAAGSSGAAGLAIAALMAAQTGAWPHVTVDRRLASLWFGSNLRPLGWSLPPAWDPIAGDYAASDGWIRLHTNAPHHRAAALSVLGCAEDKDSVTAAVARWRIDDLEAAVVAQGGCAAAMRDMAAWAAHPQGAAVQAEPLVWRDEGDPSAVGQWASRPERPLAGLRILDLTRVLAGPVATRFLAGFGAQVLRIDPPDWDEPGVLPSVTLGKRRARLDLKHPEGQRVLKQLLGTADVLVHGYRPEALDRLGLDPAARRRIRPGLIDVCLDAYGWTGPWRGRRGFDSLVQMSSGIAAEGMRHFGADRPTPLPVQALDVAAGHIMAAAVIRGLTERWLTGTGSGARTSLARTAALLTALPRPETGGTFAALNDEDFAGTIEATGWGPAHRLTPPIAVEGAPMRWDIPAGPLGSDPAAWV